MPVKFCTGDLFLSDAQTWAHGCNCQGRMGAGIAKQLKALFPNVFKEYRRRCHQSQFTPGTVYLEKRTTPWVLNLATQATTRGAELRYVRECFTWISLNYEKEGIAGLAMPRVAASLGGLNWRDVKELIVEILGPLPIPVFVYEDYVPGLKGDCPER